MSRLRRAPRATALCLLAALAACGDESTLALDDRVDLDLFTEIEETPGVSADYVQRATVTISPAVSGSDLELITRLRLLDQFDQDWVLSEDPEFVAADRGWELVAERSTNAGFRTGPWYLRMVVEEQGVFVLGHAQASGAVGSPTIAEAAVTPEGQMTVRWSAPNGPHEWELLAIESGPSGDRVLGVSNGSASGGGIMVGIDVPTSSFEEPNQLVYRLVLENDVSRRTVEGVIAP